MHELLYEKVNCHSLYIYILFSYLFECDLMLGIGRKMKPIPLVFLINTNELEQGLLS